MLDTWASDSLERASGKAAEQLRYQGVTSCMLTMNNPSSLSSNHRENATTSHQFARLVTAARINDFHFHDLRHDFATRLLRSGATIEKVSRQLAHSGLQVAMRYAHVTTNDLQAHVEAIAVGDVNAHPSSLAVEDALCSAHDRMGRSN